MKLNIVVVVVVVVDDDRSSLMTLNLSTWNPTTTSSAGQQLVISPDSNVTSSILSNVIKT